MKYLVTVFSLVAVARAVPITSGYGQPIAPVIPAPVVPPVVPVETVSIPDGPVVIEPTFRALPFSPVARAINLPRLVPVATGPIPVARTLPAAPLPQPLPLPRALPATSLAQTVPIPRAIPLAQPSLVARTLPAAPIAVPAPFSPAPISPIAKALPVPAAFPSLPSSQFQAQDEAGGFSFGYQNVNSAKEEVRSPDGVTHGAYSYVDANGIVQRVEYIADPINGFRVVGTNIPVAASAPVVDTPEVAAAKAEFQRAFDLAVARKAAPIVVDDVVVEAKPVTPVKATIELRKKRSTTSGYGAPIAPIIAVPAVTPSIVVSSTLPVPIAAGPAITPAALPLAASPALPLAARTNLPLPLAAGGPVPVATSHTVPAALPLAANVPVAATPITLPKAVIASIPSSQYHAQDELGGVSFGYQNENSARQEVRSPDGTTQGSYSYVDGNGITQTVNYIADALGFRVTGTNLPVAVAA